MLRPWRLLLDPDPSPGGGGTNPPAKDPASTPAPAADPTVGFKAALAKHDNDALGFARSAFAEAEKLRAENEQLKGKLPKEGAMILEGDALASYQALAKLGKPDEIATALTSGKEAVTRLTALERRDHLTEVAGTENWSAKVLQRLADQEGLKIELKDGTKAGKATKVAEVVIIEKDDKGAEVERRTPLAKYAEKHWPEFLPSLTGTPAEKARGTPRIGGDRANANNGNSPEAPKRVRSGF